MNQDQRELLELAAYAIGWKAEKWIDAHEGADGVQYSEYYATRRDDGVLVAFNPLTNKADAFDLMVKLGISVTPYPIYNSDERHSVIAKQRRKTDCLRESNPTEVIELYNGNAEAATMLAITRAAAAIGKQMKEQMK